MASIVNSQWQIRLEKDDQYRRELSNLCKQLRGDAISNIEYFQDKKGINNERFYVCYVHLYDHLDSGIEPGLDEMTRVLYKYDFDPSLPANGYRSIVKVIEKCCLKILNLTRYISISRENFLFRGGHYSKELDAYVSTLGQLRACLYYIEQLLTFSSNGDLFPDEESLSEKEYTRAEMLMTQVEALSQETFYGRCLGFQFCDSLIKPLTTIVLVLASFGDGYEQPSSVMKIASSVIGGGKYYLDPDSRAQQVVNVTRNGDIRFCKAFWSLAENQLIHNLPLMVCPPVSLDKVIVLDPEPFDLPLDDDSDIARINPPCAHSGPGPVYTRLLSYEHREGQEIWRPMTARSSEMPISGVAPPSPCLVIQIHGGGFVAQSSASHEVYLRHWAKDLRVPIFCFDYSLAPEDPFPRQLEETFYAYCWALKNCRLLGSTGERICMVGDSAGANLCVAVTLRALSEGIRIPDGILSIYGSMLVKYTPSPSRILSLMDPLLPIGILAKCLAAYAGIESMAPSTPNAEKTLQACSTPKPAQGPIENETDEPDPECFHDVKSDDDPEETEELSSDCVLENGSNDIQADMREAMLENGDDTGKSEICGVHTWSSTCSGLTGSSDPEEEDPDEKPGSPFVGRHERVQSIHSGDSAIVGSQNSEGSPSKSPVSPPYNMPRFRLSSDSGFQDRGEGGDSVCDINNSDAQVPSEVSNSSKGSAVNNVAGQMKNSAAEFDQSRVNGSSPGPCKSGFSLDFNLLRKRRKTDNVSLVRSPSSPILNSIQQKIRLQDLVQVQSPLSPSSPFLGSVGILNATTPTYAKLRHFAQSPVQHFKHMPISKNPFMSPYLAPPAVLQQLCPMYFVASNLDPILDDSIQFAKKLRDLGNEVHIDIVDSLPHGFLNFVLASQEAKQASDMCVHRLKDILRLNAMSDEEWEIIGAGIENGELDDILQEVEQVAL